MVSSGSGWDGRAYDAVSQQRFAVGEYLMRLAAVQPGEDVLDAGCGTGELTIKLADAAHPGRVLGIDNAPGMIKVAIHKAKTAGARNVAFRLRDMQKLDFVGEFSLIFSNSALQWAWEHEAVLAGFFRALRPGGRLALQFTAKDFSPPLLSALDRIAAEIAGCPYRGGKYPWFMGEPESYSELVKAAGFREVDIYRKEWPLRFATVQKAVAFFRAGGLQPYLALLPETARDAFCRRLAQELTALCGSDAPELPFDRLFVFGRKPRL